MTGFHKTLVYWISILISKFYSYSAHIHFGVLIDDIYSVWITHSLGIKSTNVMIRKGVKIDGAQYIKIADHVTISRNCLIETKYKHGKEKYSPELIIGYGSYLGEENHITCMNRIIIGRNLLTGRRVLISDNNHGKTTKDDLTIPPGNRKLYSKGCIEIGDNVWIGENACILGGCSIGSGVVVAANAVVTHDIPPFSLAAGVPAKVIKKLQND